MPQVWLITGSSRGLGRAFAEAALISGCQVAATARNAEDLVELKGKYGDLVLPLSLDVTSETQAREAVQATIRTFGTHWPRTVCSRQMGRGGFFRNAGERSRTPRRQGHHRSTRWFPDGLRRIVNRTAGRTSRVRCDGG
jgi:NAD(P)-dependent dehydrogenase (short-subunit alcohol dehydrogenase family)